jgi:hypothetical protein
MQYVLGNMLNGGGINPDGLSLDLQFATDKTLTARRGPTPVFTRSSGDNGGTTYFGPLVDFDLVGEIPATGITNGRASWFKSDGGDNITISYTGTRWSVITVIDGIEDEYLAAPGSEWRPDQADWSSQGLSVTTSSTFGIVKAANNEPRFDHTAAGVCRGLLIEEGRTNLLVRSEEFNDAAWTKVNASVTANGATSPSGTLTADTLVRSGTSLALLASADLVAGAVSLTSSLYAKAGTQNFLVAQVNINNGTSASFITFDLTNGTVGTRQDLINSIAFTAVATNVGNGWYRCSVTFTGGSTNSTVLFGAASNANNRNGTNGGTIFIWGAQLEAGSFPTSYIPTTTGTLARSADVCSITGDAFNNFYNQSEGTVLAKLVAASGIGSTPQFPFSISTSATTNLIAGLRAISGLLNQARLAVFVSGLDQTSDMASFGSYGNNASATIAVGLAPNNFAGSLGGSITTDSTGTIPSPDRMFIGDRFDGARTWNGHIAAIRYYKKRLPNAKLAQLTA